MKNNSKPFGDERSWNAVFAILILTVGVGFAESATRLQVAAVSFEPVKFDLEGNANRLEKAFRMASGHDARIAVAPEGALDGYVVNEIIAGKAKAADMWTVAVELDDPVIQRFQRLARELQMALVFGLAEKIGEDVFNCAVFIDHTGKICGKQHKMQFAEGYDPDWWFNRLGKQSRAFDTPYGRCGILICNDRWNPQLAKIQALDGAQFLVIPSFGSRSKAQDEAVLSRGRETGLPVIEANVGVTLIVSEGKIAAVDRERQGVTLAEIVIPAPRPADVAARAEVESDFLARRNGEMQIRLDKTMKKLADAKTAHFEIFGPSYQFVFHAVLEGLYRDGATQKEVERILMNHSKRKRSGYEHFIYSCPVCTSVLLAVRLYECRPEFSMYKPGRIRHRTDHSTFGVGFSREDKKGLNSENVNERLRTLNGLVSRWVEQRMKQMNLSDKQKEALLEDMKVGREKGMQALTRFKKDPELMKIYAPGYVNADECALCNAASIQGFENVFR